MDAGSDPELIALGKRRRRFAGRLLVAFMIALAPVGLWRVDEYRLSQMSFEDAFAAYQRAFDRPMLKYWDLRTAYRVFDRQADEFDPRAQAWLGVMYRRGDYVDKSLAAASAWWLLAASLDDPTAMTYLGDTAPSQIKAVDWYRRAADLGSVHGLESLGAAYLDGRGVPQDIDQASAMLQRAAEAGGEYAMRRLGLAYNSGLFGEPDYEQALYWCLESGKHGSFDGFACAIDLLQDEILPVYDRETGYLWALVMYGWHGEGRSWGQQEAAKSYIRSVLHPRRPIPPRTTGLIVDRSDLPPPDRAPRPMLIDAATRERIEARAAAILACWPKPPIRRDQSVEDCLLGRSDSGPLGER